MAKHGFVIINSGDYGNTWSLKASNIGDALIEAGNEFLTNKYLRKKFKKNKGSVEVFEQTGKPLSKKNAKKPTGKK